MALRLSLGAGRGRLMRQLVTESLVLAAAGGVAAAAVAAALHRALVVMLAEADPAFALSFTFDPPIAVFLVGCTFTAALLFGLLPAWQATATDALERPQGTGPRRASARGCAAAPGACSSACSSRCRCRSSSARACWRAPPTTCSASISA